MWPAWAVNMTPAYRVTALHQCAPFEQAPVLTQTAGGFMYQVGCAQCAAEYEVPQRRAIAFGRLATSKVMETLK